MLSIIVIRKEDKMKEEWEQRKKLFKWERGFGHSCKIPTKLLFKLDSNKNGCSALKFSNNGKYLAVAVTNENKKSIINAYCIENDVKKCSIGYHHEIIHEMKWNSNDKYIMACSSDCTAKIWRFKVLDDDYLFNNEKLLICSLNHPSYVYSCEFVNSVNVIDKVKLFVLTACHDGKIRMWMINTHAAEANDKFKIINEISLPIPPDVDQMRFGCIFPNAIIMDTNNRIYCGDSNGCIHVWDFQMRETKIAMPFIKTIKEPEIIGDPINCIHLTQFDKSKLVVHSRDNCLRLIENSSHRQKVLQ